MHSGRAAISTCVWCSAKPRGSCSIGLSQEGAYSKASDDEFSAWWSRRWLTATLACDAAVVVVMFIATGLASTGALGVCVKKEIRQADCTGEDVCVEGFCRDPLDACQFAYECGPGQACINGGCAPICGSDDDCGSGATCQGGFCRPTPECTTTAECGSGEHCVDGRCLPDCRGGESCDALDYCAEDDFCRPDWRRDPFCDDDGDCAMGSICVDGACRTPCPSGTNDQCLMTDVSLTVCDTDMLCYTSTEVSPECAVQGDCDADEDCVDATCR